MNRERFETILDAYGARTDRWPEAEREAAITYLETHPDARAALDAAAELDGLIQVAAVTHQPSEMLTARLLRAAPARAVLDNWHRVAAAAALTLFLGIGGGYFGGGFLPDATNDAAYDIAFDGLDSGIDFDWESGV
ncbi:MAG: hypothetical protein CMF74_08200 [Maricaulis sp.]|jgi:hypothetical protein|nr:hypothetical protein [Maricaulis sp.]HAQ36018.1 hypothetical protein [Alphaproteobacteria bacterium]